MASIFKGIRVIDLTNNMAGPLCTQMLATYGAEVLKIERPVAGDDTRAVAPIIEGQSLNYIWANLGKKSVTLDLKDIRAQDALHKLARTADVFVESYRPGTLKKYNLDYERIREINPNIVYCSISMGGQTGVYSRRPGFDIIAQAMSGLMDMTGESDGPPTKFGTVVGDYVGGINAFAGVTAALLYRERGGTGQYIDISLLDGLIGINTHIDQAATLGTKPTRLGNHHNTVAPSGVCSGNHGESCIIAAYTAGMWKRLCAAMERPDMEADPRFQSNAARTEHLAELVENIEEWLKKFDHIDEAVEILSNNEVAVGKICSVYEVANNPVHWESGILTEVETTLKKHPKVRVRGPWLRFSKTPGVLTRASDLGEYNQEILTQCGMTPEEIEQCQKEWACKFK